MPNNKGFTLVELIATVTIMLLITIIAIPTSMNFINRGKTTQYNQIKSEIEQAADKYYRQHKDTVSSSIALNALLNENLIDEQYERKNGKLVDPRNNNKCLSGNINIVITGKRVDFEYVDSSVTCN